jgi:hypothetical protein
MELSGSVSTGVLFSGSRFKDLSSIKRGTRQALALGRETPQGASVKYAANILAKHKFRVVGSQQDRLAKSAGWVPECCVHGSSPNFDDALRSSHKFFS